MKFSVNGTEYEMVQANCTFAEARAIEKITGRSFQGLLQDPEAQGSTEVIQALMWISMKRVEPTLTFSDLDDIEFGSIEWEAPPEVAAEVPTDGDAGSSAETTSPPSA